MDREATESLRHSGREGSTGAAADFRNFTDDWSRKKACALSLPRFNAKPTPERAEYFPAIILNADSIVGRRISPSVPPVRFPYGNRPSSALTPLPLSIVITGLVTQPAGVQSPGITAPGTIMPGIVLACDELLS